MTIFELEIHSQWVRQNEPYSSPLLHFITNLYVNVFLSNLYKAKVSKRNCMMDYKAYTLSLEYTVLRRKHVDAYEHIKTVFELYKIQFSKRFVVCGRFWYQAQMLPTAPQLHRM